MNKKESDNNFMNNRYDSLNMGTGKMSKQEMLIEYIIQDIVLYMISESSYEIDEAMNVFYNSAVFEKLSDIETGLYLESSAYIYELLKDDLANGRISRIIQREV